MALYRRDDSPFWWMVLSAIGRRPVRRSTQIPHDAPTAAQRAELKKQAELLFNEQQAKFVLDRHGVGPKDTITLDAYLTWYEKHVSTLKRSALAYEQTVFRQLRKDFPGALLQELTLERVREWRVQRLAEKHPKTKRTPKPSTVNRQMDVLAHVLASAVPKYLAKSPIADLRHLHVDETEIPVLSREDEAKLLQQLEPADQAIVICALDTLMRANDLIELKWAHVHQKHITVLNPKNGTSYKTPISTRLRARLEDLERDGDYVFQHRRRAKTVTLRVNSLKQLLERACKAAGVPYGRGRGITFHGLRHTGASRMVAAGVNIRTVQAIGGWKSLRSMLRYLHPHDADSQAAVEAIGQGVETARSA